MASTGKIAAYLVRPAPRRLLLLALALGGLSPAYAQDFFHGGVTPRTAAAAGIYMPDAADASDALTLNPAGLAALTGGSLEANTLGGLAQGSFTNQANVNTQLRLRPGFAPFGAVGGPLRASRWSAGLGYMPDFVSAVHWRYADAPGAAGANYGPQSEDSEILVSRAGAGLAWAPTPRLGLGVSGAMVYNQNTLIAPFIFQSNPQLRGLKTLLNLHTRGFGWGGSFGIVARPATGLTLSAAYSSPFTINGHGHASGDMGAQFRALGIPFAPAFTYSARVRVKLPQSVLVGARWRVTRALGLSVEGDWVNFHTAFEQLPVSLSHGSNADINSLLGSSSLEDRVPLQWRNQTVLRLAADHSLGEHTQFAAGFSRRSSLVPDSTVTPLTGAIMKNAFSAGLTRGGERARVGVAYMLNLNQAAHVDHSSLLSGEFDHSRLSVSTQALVVGASMRFGQGTRASR